MKYQKWLWVFGILYGVLLSGVSMVSRCYSCLFLSAPSYLMWLQWLLLFILPIYWMLVGALLSGKKSTLAFMLFLIAILLHYVGLIGGIIFGFGSEDMTLLSLCTWGIIFVSGQVTLWYFAIKGHLLS